MGASEAPCFTPAGNRASWFLTLNHGLLPHAKKQTKCEED